MKDNFFYEPIAEDFNKEKNREIILTRINHSKSTNFFKKITLKHTIAPTLVMAMLFLALFNSNIFLNHDDIIFNQLNTEKSIDNLNTKDIAISNDNTSKSSSDGKSSSNEDNKKINDISNIQHPEVIDEKRATTSDNIPDTNNKDEIISVNPNDTVNDISLNGKDINNDASINTFSLDPNKTDLILEQISLPNNLKCSSITRDDEIYTIQFNSDIETSNNESPKYTLTLSKDKKINVPPNLNGMQPKISTINNTDVTLLQYHDEIHGYFTYDNYNYHITSLGLSKDDFTTSLKSIIQ